MRISRIIAVASICMSLFLQVNLVMASDNNTNIPNDTSKEEKVIKRMNKDGTIPSKWDLPKPKVEPHPDVPPETAGGSGDGKNSIDFTFFETGDIIVTQGTATGHAGEWDATKFVNIDSKCVWSANTEPVNGVQLETPRKYRGYDEAFGIWVPATTSAQRTAAKNYCAAQNGEPYDIMSSKANESKWYCSKLCWASYKYTAANKDLDADGGYWVWPIDLVNDDDTRIFAHSN